MRSGGGSRRALLLTATLLGLAFSSAPFASSPPPTAPESGPIAPEPAGPICPGVRYAPGVRTLSLPPGPVILAPCPGGEIAYLDQGGIVVMYSNGTGNSVVYTARTSLSRPTWSPDGRSLAFRDGSQVWRIDVSLVEGRFVGSAPVALTTEEAWNPAWSPLQGEIAVTTRSPGRWSLGIIPAIGGAVQVIYLPQSGSNIFGRPGWSLDGTRIAFAEVDATGVSTIKVLDRATLSVLSSHALVGITGVRDVDWARTKDVVAFNDEVEQFPGKGVDLYTLDLKTGEATFVADQAYHASWGPDDSRIVYTKSCSYGGGCTIESFNFTTKGAAPLPRSGCCRDWGLAPVGPPLSDAVPPDPVSDLAVDSSAVAPDSLTLTWRASGDDGATGTAAFYDLRYSAEFDLTEETWPRAIQVFGEPFPGPAGIVERVTVTGLQPGRGYSFALRVFDDAGNSSALSNVVMGITATAPRGPWTVTRVDSEGSVGEWTSVAVDEAGLPHIGYRDGSFRSLKYATWNGNEWRIETVDASDGSVGVSSSIALDGAGNPHIGYGRNVNSYTWLKYAQRSGTAWAVETVDAQAQSVGYHVSLALDGAGYPHLSHGKLWGGNALKYARWTGSTWALEPVDRGDPLGSWTSIALDALDRAHITYLGEGSAKYARWTGSAWEIEIIGASAGHTSLELDALGNPHVSYGGAAGELTYARWTGTSWAIDGLGVIAGYTSLELDASGNPHIAYFDSEARDLRYARWNGTAWVLETVDYTGDVGRFASLALDDLGVPHISYYDATNADLKYARRGPLFDSPGAENDDFDSTTRIGSLPFMDRRDTTSAMTASDDPNCGGRGGTVWYAFTATEDAFLVASTAGSSYDTTLSVYAGSRGSLTQIACNDTSPTYGSTAEIAFPVRAGRTYYLMVGSHGDTPGGDLIIGLGTGERVVSADERQSVGIARNIPNISGGKGHRARVEYTPGTLSVYLDDLTSPALALPLRLGEILASPDGQAWVGFTAATGTYFENHDILSFTFGSSPATEAPLSMTLVGEAQRLGDTIRLTPSEPDRVGGAWSASRQPVMGGFVATFDFEITQFWQSYGADGFTFIVQNDGGSALGRAGGDLGYHLAFSKTLVIEFDTWRNPELYDPNTNHLSVHVTPRNGLVEVRPSVETVTASTATSVPGQDVTFVASTWDPDGDILSYAWNFGDGQTVAGFTAPGGGDITVTHAYMATGTYTATITVDDGDGGVASSSTSVVVPEPALLRVTTDPPVPGAIFVDGVPRDEWSLNWMKIAPGRHTVSFGDVYGYGTPALVDIEATSGTVTEIVGTYELWASLRVTTNPPLPAAIYVDGVPANEWSLWRAIAPGTYTVSFGPVPGYGPPDAQTITLTPGEFRHVEGAFRPDPNAPGPDPATFGLLRVTTDPPVPAQILVDGIPRDEWGLNWLKVPPGTYAITFSAVYGLGRPPGVPAVVTVVAGQTTEYEGQFVVHGTLRVTTDPPVPATFFVDGIPRNDWSMWQSMPPGPYRISFGPVPGYVTPQPQTAVVASGQLTTVAGTYWVSVSNGLAEPATPNDSLPGFESLLRNYPWSTGSPLASPGASEATILYGLVPAIPAALLIRRFLIVRRRNHR